MVGNTARQIGLAGFTGLLYPLCFPDFDLGFLAWILLVPLHYALIDVSPRRAFWLGWLAGTIGFVGTMAWVVTAMNLYGKVPLPLSYALMLLLAAYLGLYLGAYALAVAWLRPRLPSLAFLGAPCLWVTLELLRTYLFSGLPWSLLGYSQYRWLPMIQIADHVGVYGLSFLIVLVNGAVTEAGAWAWSFARRRPPGAVPWVSPAAAVLGTTVALLYGYAQLEAWGHAGSGGVPGMDRSITVGLVQANIDQGHKWDPAFREDTLNRYKRLSGRASAGADLLLWPEAATPFIFEQEVEYRAEVHSLVRALETPLLLGSPAVRFYPNGRPYLLNSAYLLSRDGRISGRYDKQHLVPFGEYIPLHSSLLFFLDKLVEGIGDFEAGTAPTVLVVPHRPPNRPLKFGVVICYEVIFPNLVREFAASGAEFMVTITNDAWFGASVAPHQHFGMVVLRAVENRLAFARAANTGVSGFIDPLGRILHATPIFQEAAVKGEIPVGRIPTFYTQYGDVFAYGCVIISGILFASAYRRGRQWARGKGQ